MTLLVPLRLLHTGQTVVVLYSANGGGTLAQDFVSGWKNVAISKNTLTSVISLLDNSKTKCFNNILD